MAIHSADYEKILKFSAFINKDFDHYVQNVLFAMDEFFGYPLCVYTIIGVTPEGRGYVEGIYSNSIHPQGLQRYQQDYYETDLFASRLTYHKTSPSPKHVHTITDVASYDEFYATAYGRYLQDIGTPYQVVMRGAHTKYPPLHVLNVFKNRAGGDFDEYERELFECIGRVFDDSVDLYKRNIAAKNHRLFLDHLTQGDGTALAVVDERSTVVYANPLFLQKTSALLGAQSVYSGVLALLDALKEQTGQTPDALADVVELALAGHTVRFEPQLLVSEEGVCRHLFLTVDAHDVASRRDWAAPDHFGFTLREAEVAKLLVQGMDNPQIAAALCVNIATAKFHVKNIFRKLGVNKRPAAISKLLQQR